jgi:hypothetical protein
MTETRRCEGLDSWEIEMWITRLGSFPVERVKHADHSEDYAMREAHVLRLESGQFALVTESGCSCYESSDAEIELFPSRSLAVEAFDKWDKENRRGGVL